LSFFKGICVTKSTEIIELSGILFNSFYILSGKHCVLHRGLITL
jgi:hypothetical protein